MALFASLADSRVVTARVTLPAWGRATADVRLADDDALPPGPVLLTIGNLSLAMTSVPDRDGPFAGSRSVRLVAGMGGWSNDVAARFYAFAQPGVRLATVLRDVAAEVGETIVVSAAQDRSIGPFFARAAGPASRVLAALVGREAWWIDPAGVTRIGERTATAIVSDFDIPEGGYTPSARSVVIATEDLASWQPGAVFEHRLLDVPLQVCSTRIDLAPNGRLRLEVLAQ